jgi:hypothetical protein
MPYEGLSDEQRAKIREIELWVSDHIKYQPGISAVVLISRVYVEFPGEDNLAIIEQMVTDGKIVEVEYVLSTMDYRIKSVYFPMGTRIIGMALTSQIEKYDRKHSGDASPT